MTAIVKFKINKDTKNLEVFIEEGTATDIEMIYAKKILSLSTQLNFVDLPNSNSIDLGSSIVIEEEFYDDLDDDEEDFNDDLDDDEELEEIIEVVTVEELIEVDPYAKFTGKITHNDGMIKDNYVSISVDLKDAQKVVGGLTTPSCVATMMIYELLKRTLAKMESVD